MMMRIDCPMASVAVYPNMRSAAAFDDRMIPFKSLLTMASSDESTILAKCRGARSSVALSISRQRGRNARISRERTENKSR
jgi:hypothetical protein